MKNDKILLNISKIEDLEKFKKLGISNFLFPLKDFSIGSASFSFEEIASTGVEAYVLVNRILTDDDIDIFMELSIPDNVKGFIIEDTGLLYELKDSKYELINFQNHLNNNYETVNFWLDYFDSLVVSSDITADEIATIFDKSSKPLVLSVLFYPMIMYSRRNLVGNYYRHLNEPQKRRLNIDVFNSNSTFKLVENDYGTAVFDSELVDIRAFAVSLDEKKIKFYLIDTNFLDFETVKSALKGDNISLGTLGFLNKKTVYKVGDLK